LIAGSAGSAVAADSVGGTATPHFPQLSMEQLNAYQKPLGERA